MTDVPKPGAERDEVLARQGLLLLLGVIAAGTALVIGFGVLASGCAASFGQSVDAEFRGAPDNRPPVKAIPVPQTSCLYLQAVGVRAAAASTPWTDTPLTGPWTRFQARLNQKLPPLAIALEAAIPHVPTRVALDLKEVLHQVTIGETTLQGTTSITDYLIKSHDAVLKGTAALAHASNLVGDACGAPLLASPIADLATQGG